MHDTQQLVMIQAALLKLMLTNKKSELYCLLAYNLFY
jgi:hypothetical protein